MAEETDLCELEILVSLIGDEGAGKTRATKAIEKALKAELSDKPYRVRWTHIIGDQNTETGTFENEVK